jgi:hypothetical protein
MNGKLIVKVLFLVLVFLLVALARQQLGSSGFKESLNALFGVGGAKNAVNWCVDDTVDFQWTNAEVPESMKAESLRSLRNHYCELSTEPIAGVDLEKVTWAPLAESHGPAGQMSKLEWNKENDLFMSGGLPFKSTKLAAELKSQSVTK